MFTFARHNEASDDRYSTFFLEHYGLMHTCSKVNRSVMETCTEKIRSVHILGHKPPADVLVMLTVTRSVDSMSCLHLLAKMQLQQLLGCDIGSISILVILTSGSSNDVSQCLHLLAIMMP